MPQESLRRLLIDAGVPLNEQTRSALRAKLAARWHMVKDDISTDDLAYMLLALLKLDRGRP